MKYFFLLFSLLCIKLAGEYIDPQAFLKRRGSSLECTFPVQVQVMCCLDAPPAPANDPDLKKVILIYILLEKN